MESEVNFIDALDLLEWQLELGVTETIGNQEVNRYLEVKPKSESETKANITSKEKTTIVEPTLVASSIANAANSLDDLAKAISSFDYCDLKKGARNLVFSDGSPSAKVMIIGEIPDREEDIVGKPFVGEAGVLLDKMFNAIGYGRSLSKTSIYLTNVVPWRTPQNRPLTLNEQETLKPFLVRHIELIQPKFLIVMGNTPSQILLNEDRITKLRGKWNTFSGIPTLPMLHPSYLLRNPSEKKETWEDLKMLKIRLGEDL